jgi:hypothetical protein
MYTVDKLHPSVVADLKEAAQLELDRVWELFSERKADWFSHKGTALENIFFAESVELHKQYDAVKSAYKALGFTGSIGIHQL